MKPTPFAVLLVSALLLGSSGLAVADKNGRDGEHRVAHEEHGGKFLVRSDNLTVWFHEGRNHAKPDLRVAFPSGGNDTDEKSGYRVQVLRLYETAPNSTEPSGKLPRMNLASAQDWNVVTDDADGDLTVTMTRSEAQAIVTLVFHINTTSNVVKYDVDVKNWRWANASDDLALDMLVIGHDLRNETGARVSVEGAGYISWAPSAVGTFADGTRTLAVTSGSARFDKDKDHDENETGESDHEREERDSGRGGHVILAFRGAGGATHIAYDPEFGVLSTRSTATKPVPAAGPTAVALALVGAAVLAGATRRRK